MSWVTASLARTLLLLALLTSAWLLWSGQFKPLLLGLGAFSCVLVGYLTRRMGYIDNEFFEVNFNLRFFGYWAWLGKEVVRSSIEVARVVLDPRLPISPRIVEVEATARHPVDQVIFGIRGLCVHYAEAPDGEDAIFCVRYIQGFIDGAVATDERVMINVTAEYENEETFSERAIRVRSPSRGGLSRYGPTAYAEFCLGEPVTLREVVEHVVNDLMNRKFLEETLLARDAVYAVLRRDYPCETANDE